MKRQRIGIDFHSWDGIFQGSRSHLLGIYQAAIEQAPDIDFVFFLKDCASLAREYPAFTRPNVTLVATTRLPSWLRLTWQLPWQAHRHHIDVLHMQYRLPVWTTTKTVCTIHDLLCESHPQFFGLPFVWMAKVTTHIAVRKCESILTVSEYSKSELIQRHRIEPKYIGVTANGVDPSRFYPAQRVPDQQLKEELAMLGRLGLSPGQYILTVGRLEPRKNQANLIRAWGQLDRDAPTLVVVGQPDFSFKDISRAQSEVARPVKLLSRVQDHELPVLMRHARLFAYPAYAEGFGMPVIEALASGVPVVTSDTTSLPEVAGPQAILVNPNAVSSIRDGLLAGLALKGAEKQRVIDAGLAQAANYNWRDSARVLISHLRRALDSV